MSLWLAANLRMAAAILCIGVFFGFFTGKVAFDDKAVEYNVPLPVKFISVIAGAMLAFWLARFRSSSFRSIDDEVRRESLNFRRDPDDDAELTTPEPSSSTEATRNPLFSSSQQFEGKDVGLSFHSSLRNTILLLGQKIDLCDRKASGLLDRGVGTCVCGVVLFVGSTVGVQALAWGSELKSQHILLAISSSVLFIFLQFLSAWFLKQYRHYVEVSTYLLEIKSVFDRYELLYWLSDPEGEPTENSKTARAAVIEALKEEMKWPRARPGFTDDSYFARDAMGSLMDRIADLTAAIRSMKKD